MVDALAMRLGPNSFKRGRPDLSAMNALLGRANPPAFLLSFPIERMQTLRFERALSDARKQANMPGANAPGFVILW